MRNGVLISLLIFCASFPVLACDCAPHSMKGDFKSVDFVIKGEVVGINDLKYSNIENTLTYRLNPEYVQTSGYSVQINVSTVFKGTSEETLVITPEWTNCDYLFEKNSKYVIFGYTDKNGHRRTNICTKTFKMNSKDMSRLKAILRDES